MNMDVSGKVTDIPHAASSSYPDEQSERIQDKIDRGGGRLFSPGVLCGFYADTADVPPEVPYLRVLACNERGRKLLKTIKKTGSAPVLTKSADVRALSEEAQKLFALTARAADQYVLAYPELRAARGSSAWTEGPVIV